MKYSHVPILLKEAIEFLNVKKGRTFVDCTLGGGGHTEELKIQNLSPEAIPARRQARRRGGKLKIYGIDRDEEALEAAKSRLAKYKNIIYVKDNFKNLKKIVKEKADGVLFDLGISSYQIDEASRGFSLQKDGPLDMRMDQSQKHSAEEVVNCSRQEELERIFIEYGEERFARRIAKAIVAERKAQKIRTTLELRKIIEEAIPTWKKRESATRIFQSLRLAVNQELESLKSGLKDAIDLLKPQGRIVVISYHSLEDRIAKQTFKKAAHEGLLKILTKKPIRPGPDEISSNPRAKSAKLRAAEKI